MKKVLFICSDGGHLSEMETLRPLFDEYESTLVVEQTNRDVSDWADECYTLKKGTRHQLFRYLFIFASNIIQSIFIFHKVKPDVIVTTGSHTAVPMCYLASWHRKKIFFIESIARVKSKSMTGSIIEKKCSKIFVQWPEMLNVYENAELIGPVL